MIIRFKAFWGLAKSRFIWFLITAVILFSFIAAMFYPELSFYGCNSIGCASLFGGLAVFPFTIMCILFLSILEFWKISSLANKKTSTHNPE